jgi:malonyl-CoA O-methyltransferase
MNESPERLAIDPALVRRRFERTRLLDADDFLQREVSRRMSERLASIRLDASRVLDIGCGTGGDLAMLRERFAGATVCGIDASWNRLARARRHTDSGTLARLLRRRSDPWLAQADFAALPFAPHSFDCLWSNLALHWSAEPHRVLPEWSRVTKVGGLVAFSAFGPDTLREVEAASQAVGGERLVMPFTDMHDYGDMLVAAGFTTPVVDMERVTLTYADTASLWRDVRGLGGNAALGRSRGLHGRRFRTQLDEAVARGRGADDRYALTFELIFAHAWKGEPRKTRSGETIVRLERPR